MWLLPLPKGSGFPPLNVFMIVRYFIGIKRKNLNSVVYSLFQINQHGKISQNEPVVLKRNFPLSSHRAILIAMNDAIERTITMYGMVDKLIIHTLDDDIRFEWMIEYKNDHRFSEQTEDRDLWNRIADTVKYAGINMTIEGKESVLAGLILTRRQP